MLRLLGAALLASALAAPSIPDQAGLAEKAVVRDHETLEWKAVVGLPPGAEVALLTEDPVTHAVEALVRFPSRYRVPIHWHSHSESIVVVKGKLKVLIEGKGEAHGPGSSVLLPAGLLHGFETGWRGCVFSVRTDRPFDMFYADPQDANQ